MNSAYRNLADAVVLRAVTDWQKAVKVLKKNPNYKASLEMKKDCEEFFKGAWYQDLREVFELNIPEDMLKVLEEER